MSGNEADEPGAALRPRQIQLPVHDAGAATTGNLRAPCGPATAPILTHLSHRPLLPRSPSRHRASNQRHYTARDVELDYFSLPESGLTASPGQQLASQAQPDLRLVRPHPLRSSQPGKLVERTSPRNPPVSPITPLSPSPWPVRSHPRDRRRCAWSRPVSANMEASRSTGILPTRPGLPASSRTEMGPLLRGFDREYMVRRTSRPSTSVDPTMTLQASTSTPGDVGMRPITPRTTSDSNLDPYPNRSSISSLAASLGSRVHLGDFHHGTTSPAAESRDTHTPCETADTLAAPMGLFNNTPGLHGIGGGTQFGASVRKKVLHTLDTLIQLGPLPPQSPGRIVQIVEYGAVNSRGFPLIQAVIACLAQAMQCKSATTDPSELPDSPRTNTSFWVLHCDAPDTDFRPLMSALASDPESYLAPGWAARTNGVADEGVYHSFADRPFGTCVAPRGSVDFGVSLMDLHWGHTSASTPPADAATADAELNQFLQARAIELRHGAQLVVAYIARGDGHSRPSSVSQRRPGSGAASPEVELPRSSHVPAGGDVWSVLSGLLAPSLQRLVSYGMLKADVARSMLTLPLHPRTTAQSVATLRAQEDNWEVDWACGLGDYPTKRSSDTTDRPASEPDPIRIPHPAWVSFNAGALSRVAYGEHLIALIKNLYQAHWRMLLTRRGRLSTGAVAFTLDSIYDVLQTRLDSPDVPLHRIEFEMCIYSLRRK